MIRKSKAAHDEYREPHFYQPVFSDAIRAGVTRARGATPDAPEERDAIRALPAAPRDIPAAAAGPDGIAVEAQARDIQRGPGEPDDTAVEAAGPDGTAVGAQARDIQRAAAEPDDTAAGLAEPHDTAVEARDAPATGRPEPDATRAEQAAQHAHSRPR